MESVETRRVKYNEPDLQFQNIGKLSFKYTGSRELSTLSSSDLSSLTSNQICLKILSSLLDAQCKEHCTPPTDRDTFCDLSCIDDVIKSLISS